MGDNVENLQHALYLIRATADRVEGKHDRDDLNHVHMDLAVVITNLRTGFDFGPHVMVDPDTGEVTE